MTLCVLFVLTFIYYLFWPCLQNFFTVIISYTVYISNACLIITIVTHNGTFVAPNLVILYMKNYFSYNFKSLACSLSISQVIFMYIEEHFHVEYELQVFIQYLLFFYKLYMMCRLLLCTHSIQYRIFLYEVNFWIHLTSN